MTDRAQPSSADAAARHDTQPIEIGLAASSHGAATRRPPVTLGRHHLLFPVGHGGMSDVYLALVSSAAGVNKLLVVKLLRASLLDEPAAQAMFMDEARLAARLHHANVVQTYEVGQQGPLPYMTMEFLDGQPLHRVLQRLPDRSQLTLGMRLRVIIEMLHGLHYAHELRDYDGTPLRVVHRDVSPQNLFVTYDGQIKLVDFGIAKVNEQLTDSEGALQGKLAYMAPEQAAGELVDRRCDVFAAGVMLWELLSGRRLWQGCNEATIARRLVGQQLPPLDLDGVDARLLDICRTALAPAPAQRYADAESFCQALERHVAAADLDESPRAIGACVAEAFAVERADMRDRIEHELRRHVDGPNAADSSASLWRDDYRSEIGDVTRPDEITADYGPQLAVEAAAPAEPPRAPVREISGTLGMPDELPAESRARRWWPALPIAMVVTLVVIAAGSTLLDDPTPDDEPSAEPSPPTPEAPPLDRPSGCDVPVEHKPRVALSGVIDEDATLHCDRNYVLTFNTHVSAGATLTIEPGTTIFGDRETKGALIVEPGARLIADGTPARPIVFTSERPEAERAPGDWGGVLLLGRAPINLRDANGQPMRGKLEGLARPLLYGGDDPDDDSGVLRYVRIEYPGVEVAPANEINGLTLAGVGRRTIIDHVEVRASEDDCFEFFGGTVDAKHLVCDAPGDDALDFDNGYQGRIQFVVVRDLQLDGTHDETSNGLELDNDPNGDVAEPRTRPVIANLSLCGVAGGHTASFAVLARRAAQLDLYGAWIGGFDHALDVRDADTRVAVQGVMLDQQSPAEPDESDDDAAFDELAFLAARTHAAPAALAGCAGAPLGLLPTTALTADGFAGPDDPFFDDAPWIGAFAGPQDDWTQPWVVWTDAR